MARARKSGSTGRRLGRFGRPVLAAGLLAALGWAAFQGVNRSTDASDSGRRADRLQVTQAVGTSAGGWLQARIDEAKTLATRAGSEGAAAVGGDALLVDRSLHQLAGNQRYAGSDGALLVCRTPDGDDAGLRKLVQDVAAGAGPTVRAFEDPSCAPVVAAAAPSTNGLVAVVLASPNALAARLDTLAHLPNAHALFVGPSGSRVEADGTVAPPPDPNRGQDNQLQTFVDSHQGHDGITTGSGVVRAWAPTSAEWMVVVDQATPEFLGSQPTQPSNWIPAAVAICFAFAIVVVGVFDARRRRALARAEEVRSSFLAVVSHELRTPLTVLKGFIDTLVARWSHLGDEQRQQLVERLAPQVRRLHRGVDRLLIAADIQRGAQLRLASEQVDLEDVASVAVDGFRPLAPLHTFAVDVPPELTVVGDKKGLGQVLDQLVDNAVKYSPSGGTVTVRARRASKRIELVVEDEGVGLPSDYSRIFEPLTQGEEVDGRVHDEGGVGVGLYIVRALVEAMGGRVRAERRGIEPGARLVVTLVAGSLRPQGGGQLAPSGRVHGH